MLLSTLVRKASFCSGEQLLQRLLSTKLQGEVAMSAQLRTNHVHDSLEDTAEEQAERVRVGG